PTEKSAIRSAKPITVTASRGRPKKPALRATVIASGAATGLPRRHSSATATAAVIARDATTEAGAGRCPSRSGTPGQTVTWPAASRTGDNHTQRRLMVPEVRATLLYING